MFLTYAGSSEGTLASCTMSAIYSTVPASAPKKCAREGHDEAWTGDVPVLHRRNRAGGDIRLCGELSLAQAALSYAVPEPGGQCVGLQCALLRMRSPGWRCAAQRPG